MVHYKLAERIIKSMKNGEVYSQKQISSKIKPINRAILTGYLRCLHDLGKIESEDVGKAKIYFLKKGGKNE